MSANAGQAGNGSVRVEDLDALVGPNAHRQGGHGPIARFNSLLIKGPQYTCTVRLIVIISVADPGCLSWIPDPDFLPIPDPKPSTKERREKKISCHTFICRHKFPKIENYFIFEILKKKSLPSFQRFIELFTKNLPPSSKYMGLGSGIRNPQH
jgi:hypothetical protein